MLDSSVPIVTTFGLSTELGARPVLHPVKHLRAQIDYIKYLRAQKTEYLRIWVHKRPALSVNLPTLQFIRSVKLTFSLADIPALAFSMF